MTRYCAWTCGIPASDHQTEEHPFQPAAPAEGLPSHPAPGESAGFDAEVKALADLIDATITTIESGGLAATVPAIAETLVAAGVTPQPAVPAEGLREERAAAYCASEHGGHASGPACDDGRRHVAALAEGLAAAAQPILDRALDVFDPDDLDPESSLAMPVTLKARWVYALRAALTPKDDR